MEKIQCTNCGCRISEKKNFCPECGNRLLRSDDEDSVEHTGNLAVNYLQRYKIPIAIASAAIVIIIMTITIISNVIANNPANTYNKAIELFAGGQYYDALQTIRRLDENYNDARILQYYYEAYYLFHTGLYDKAASAFEKISSYKDCTDMMLESRYMNALSEYDMAKLSTDYLRGYEIALREFANLGDYKDARLYAEKIPDEKKAAEQFVKDELERQRIAAQEAERAAAEEAERQRIQQEEAERERIAEEERKATEELLANFNLDGTWVSYDPLFTQTLRFDGNKVTMSLIGLNFSSTFTIDGDTLNTTIPGAESLPFRIDGDAIILNGAKFTRQD